MKMTKPELIVLAHSTQAYVVRLRNELHAQPETRYETPITRALIMRELNEMIVTDCPFPVAIPVDSAGKVKINHYKESRGGIVVDIDVAGATERILFRADFDALNVPEATGLPCTSVITGKSHACGHDTHTAMLLGFVRCVAESKIVPSKNIRVVFQDAEENPLDTSGGATLVKDSVLTGVTEAHALHIWATGKAGSFISRPGPMLGSSDRLKVVIKTTGGHVAFPDKGSNAIDIGASVLAFMTGFWNTRYDRNEPVSFAPAAFNAGSGTASNVRPSQVELWFACRGYLDAAKRSALHAELKDRIAKVVAVYSDATVEVTIISGHPALINSANSYEATRLLLEEAGQETETMEKMLGGEDFSWYLEGQGGVPGSMWMLGAYQDGCGDHHTPKFNPDESVFWQGVLFWLLLATK